MRRNKVPYDAFSDEENEKKRTIVNTLEEEEEESEEMNEEELYLQEIRRERLLKQLTGEPNGDEEKEEEEKEEEESECEGFDPEEVKEIEAFKQRLHQRRELERSRSQRPDFNREYVILTSFVDIVSFDNPEVASFLQPSSSFSSTVDSPSGSLVRVNSLKTNNSMQSRRLTRQNVGIEKRTNNQSVSHTPNVLSNSMISSLSRNSTRSSNVTVRRREGQMITRCQSLHFCSRVLIKRSHHHLQIIFQVKEVLSLDS